MGRLVIKKEAFINSNGDTEMHFEKNGKFFRLAVSYGSRDRLIKEAENYQITN